MRRPGSLTIIPLYGSSLKIVRMASAASAGSLTSCMQFSGQATLFEDYRIESRSENQIYLEVALDALGKALRSAEAAGVCPRLARYSDVPLTTDCLMIALFAAG